MKLSFLLPILTISLSIFATPMKYTNLPYYEKETPRIGNTAYIDERCKLDLFIPQGKKDFSTLVWFHGGGFVSGSKIIQPAMAPDQYAVVTVAYRFSDDRGIVEHALCDAAAALAWVKKHIREYGGNPDRIYVTGHSAGGYITSMLALAPRFLAPYGLKPLDFAAFLPISSQMSTHFRILEERQAAGQKTPAIVLDDFSPIQLADEKAPRMVLITGDPELETPGRAAENRLLYERLKYVYKKQNVKLYSLQGFSHVPVVPPALHIINNILTDDFKGN